MRVDEARARIAKRNRDLNAVLRVLDEPELDPEPKPEPDWIAASAALGTSNTATVVATGLGPVSSLAATDDGRVLWHCHTGCSQEAVREALRSGEAGDTVTDLALRFGFTNPGRFTQLYKAAFGESPLDALRREAPRRRHAR